jgi:phosphohistidine phosphatase
VLLRHAKATSGGETSDVERPLTDDGTAAAAAVGRWLAGQGVVPDAVVVSPALRARQTWARAAEQLGRAPDPTLDERILDNTVADLLEVVREATSPVTTLVLVGHNPGVHELATLLDDGAGDATGRERLAAGYPAGGVAVFAVPGGWPDVDAGAATLTAFALPR